MSYIDDYLEASHTNPELPTSIDNPPIKLEIDHDKLQSTLGTIYEQYHKDD
jgi:hypothetical protein